MRLADLLVEHLAQVYNVKVVFTITGGGAMYLNDAFGSNSKIKYISLHHEQSVSMAAESYARVGNVIGICQVTTGPGGTNAISGCAGAWIDSCPVLFISGQVETFSISNVSTRQTGVQEVNIIDIVKPITKEAIQLSDPNLILYEIDRLFHIAMDNRKGPVWIDIPLDLQNYYFDKPSNLIRYKPNQINKRFNDLLNVKINKFAGLLKKAERPIFLVGNGSRGAIKNIIEFSDKYNIPLITGWNARDLVPNNNKNLLGSAGQFGNRLANISIANSDLIVGIGYRFSIPQIGYDPSLYAPQALIISVDIDEAEITKYSGFIDFGIKADIKVFFDKFSLFYNEQKKYIKWNNSLEKLKKFSFDSGLRDKKNINSFDFTDLLSKYLPPKSVVITDMGTSFTCTHQQLKITDGCRMMTSSGLAAMGFGLPGAIGASFVDTNNPITLVTGDGGIMFNIQELQSIVTFNLPIKIILYENDGYLTMKLMQKGRFNRYVSSDKSSGIGFPKFEKICGAFGIKSKNISAYDEMEKGLTWLYSDLKIPSCLIVHTEPFQELTPRVQTQSLKDGSLLPGTLDNMYPFLDAELKKDIENIFN